MWQSGQGSFLKYHQYYHDSWRYFEPIAMLAFQKSPPYDPYPVNSLCAPSNQQKWSSISFVVTGKIQKKKICSMACPTTFELGSIVNCMEGSLKLSCCQFSQWNSEIWWPESKALSASQLRLQVLWHCMIQSFSQHYDSSMTSYSKWQVFSPSACQRHLPITLCQPVTSYSKWHLFSPSPCQRHLPITLILTPAVWNMVSHCLALFSASNYQWMGLVSLCMKDALHWISLVLTHFLFGDKGMTMHSCSEFSSTNNVLGCIALWPRIKCTALRLSSCVWQSALHHWGNIQVNHLQPIPYAENLPFYQW